MFTHTGQHCSYGFLKIPYAQSCYYTFFWGVWFKHKQKGDCIAAANTDVVIHMYSRQK